MKKFMNNAVEMVRLKRHNCTVRVPIGSSDNSELNAHDQLLLDNEDAPIIKYPQGDRPWCIACSLASALFACYQDNDLASHICNKAEAWSTELLQLEAVMTELHGCPKYHGILVKAPLQPEEWNVINLDAHYPMLLNLRASDGGAQHACCL